MILLMHAHLSIFIQLHVYIAPLAFHAPTPLSPPPAPQPCLSVPQGLTLSPPVSQLEAFVHQLLHYLFHCQSVNHLSTVSYD